MSNHRTESLNGGKTRPLTKSAIGVLVWLRDSGPQPRQVINAGHNDRFEREQLTEIVALKSPYDSHKGKLIPFVQITAYGREVLGDLGR